MSWVLILGIALAVGGAAALLTAAATAPTTPSTSPSLLRLSETAFEWVLVVGLLGVVAFLIFDRIRQGAVAYPTRIFAVAVTVIVILTIYAVAGRVDGGGSVTPLVPVGPGSNGTAGDNSSGGGPPTNATAGSFAPFAFSLPGWALFALVAIIGIVSIVVAMRVFGARARSQGEVSTTLSDAELRGLLVDASDALDSDEEPRVVLIRLYGLLIAHLTPLVGDTDPETAEEIRAGHLVRLGIGAETAREITRLFEEARYSSHPIGPPELARAKAAIHEAIRELDAKDCDPT